MALYGNFAEKIEKIYYEALDCTLTNSTKCPNHKTSPCRNDENKFLCCLGADKQCTRECPNNKK